MGFYTKWRLALLDKSIMRSLKKSKWYLQNAGRDLYSMSLRDIDRSEQWIKEVERFADIVMSDNLYLNRLKSANVTRADIIDFFLLMTMATMPHPVFKTGPAHLSATLTGSAMYQDPSKQLERCLEMLGKSNNERDQKQFGHSFAPDVMIFAIRLKGDHDLAYGPTQLS